MYQIRITDPDGSNPIILENANNISYNKAFNAKNEGISFELPASHYKSALVTESSLWEFWDTSANERLNRGPIHNIDNADGVLKISGPGRSQFLADRIKEQLTVFYAPTDKTMDTLRYENVAINPSTKTYVWDGDAATKSVFFPSSMSIDTDKYMQFHGLSKQTKDNAIDNEEGYILPGVERPSNTPYVTTISYWSGTDKKDSWVIDLGDATSVQYVTIKFPWWGGNRRINDRQYDFKLYYSSYEGPFSGIQESDWHLVFTSTDYPRIITRVDPYIIYFTSGSNVLPNKFYTGSSIPATQFFRILITDTHAIAANPFVLGSSTEYYDWECDPNTTIRVDTNDNGVTEPGIMVGKKINDRTLEPPNDCHASIVEFGAWQEIVPLNEITPLIKQRIKGDSKQIDYFHTADASETITTGNYRRYEPGTFFKRASVSYSGASASYTKFFDNDCTNCYAAFNFGAMDDFNSLVYHSTSSSGTPTVRIPRFARSLTMKGATNAVVNDIDAWLGVVDPLSWGGQYVYSSTTNDTAILHFRGQSLIWWATIPATETGATVELQLRSKNESTGNWSAYSTLEAGLVLPNDITSEVVYEITLESGMLAADTTYEFKIKNLDGNYASVDSFGGWWVGSAVDYNDDTDKVEINNPSDWKQIYDSRFSNGTMQKCNQKGNHFTFNMIGDRMQLYSAKGRNHGQISLVMSYANGRVMIPGGDTQNGSYTIDLDTGKKGNEIPGVLIFDTRDFSGWKLGPGGTPMDTLPWGLYSLRVELHFTETYLTDFFAEDSDQFVSRCSDCGTTTGTDEMNKFIYVDGFGLHEIARLSGTWKLQSNLDILASITEALELEWDIGEQGLTVLPRIGEDTDVILLEGANTVISTDIVRDISKMATMLYSSGADIDGLPLFSIVEDRKNKIALGRTVQQIQDYRDIADYFTLVGVSRAELRRRAEPEFRINVTHIGYQYGLNPGDSFIIKKKTQDALRARINSVIINQSKSNGITYQLECEKWPPII